MAVFFVYERVKVVLRVAVPLLLGVDMIHSFYFVGCLIMEKRALDAERARRETLHSTASLFQRICEQCNRTDFSFWPKEVTQKLISVSLPDISTLPRPSYELEEDDEEPKTLTKPSHAVQVHSNQTQISNTPSSSTLQETSEENFEESKSDIEVSLKKPSSSLLFVLSGWVETFYEWVVPYPIRHPWKIYLAIQNVLGRELRLHLKKSDHYFTSRGLWIRQRLHLPPLIIERRSALRFRFRTAAL